MRFHVGKLAASITVFLLLVAIVAAALLIDTISKDVKNPSAKFWQDQYVAGYLILLLGTAATTAFGLRKGFSILVPGFHQGNILVYEGWPALTTSEFLNRFQHDGTFKDEEDFIEAKGNGTIDRSEAFLKTPLKHSFSASVQVRSNPNKKSTHWRAGLFIFSGQSEVLCLHIDCFNMIAAYFNTSRRVLYVPANKDLQSFWSTLTVYVSEESSFGDQLGSKTYHIYGCLDQHCFYLGTMPLQFPLRLSVQAWSDTYKDHDVLFKSVSISEQLSV